MVSMPHPLAAPAPATPAPAKAPRPAAVDAVPMERPSRSMAARASEADAIVLEDDEAEAAPARRAQRGHPIRRGPVPPRLIARPPVEMQGEQVSPYEGEFAEVMDLLKHKKIWPAMVKARVWRERDPGDVLALVALGEAAEASADTTLASRAYGSLIDLFPGRADLRRYAGERLERIRDGRALELAADTYRKAVEQRPDPPASHRLLGMALLKLGRHEEAFEALAKGLAERYPEGRFRGAAQILGDDVSMAAAAWIRAQPAKRAYVEERLRRTYRVLDAQPLLRFVLVWETDANDVDFHIIDGQGNHAYYGNMLLPTGGSLYADVTTGYGPECFAIPYAAVARGYPYRLQAHYYSRGPMGYGMGKLQIIEHDGKGGVRFEERPFIVMRDQAFVDLGEVRGPLAAGK
jgi:tetratricopeptide (TPR) repeat protein